MRTKPQKAIDWEKLAKQCGYRVGEAAQKLGISLRTLERQLWHEYRIRPRQFFRKLKQQDIRQQFRAGRQGKEIFNETGFAHPSSLSRFLRRVQGIERQAPKSKLLGLSQNDNQRLLKC
jgi:AraC-like DNA-binding protein